MSYRSMDSMDSPPGWCVFQLILKSTSMIESDPKRGSHVFNFLSSRLLTLDQQKLLMWFFQRHVLLLWPRPGV